MLAFIKKIYYQILRKKKQRYIASLVRKGLKIGQNVEIIDTFFFDPSHCFLISIGNNCTICPNVRLIAHDASTKKHLGYTKIGKIEIGENCFIGDSVIILPNVSIGNNVIIGAGSVVTKDIASNRVVTGNPAKDIYGLDDYIKKIKKISSTKKIFDEKYLINNLTAEKADEMIQSIGDSIGFIV